MSTRKKNNVQLVSFTTFATSEEIRKLRDDTQRIQNEILGNQKKLTDRIEVIAESLNVLKESLSRNQATSEQSQCHLSPPPQQACSSRSMDVAVAVAGNYDERVMQRNKGFSKGNILTSL